MDKLVRTVNNGLPGILGSFIILTKPSIMLLVVSSSMVALLMADGLKEGPMVLLLVLVAVYLTGGSANALNQYFERDVDARMNRTKYRRPLPLGTISPNAALLFSLFIGVIGVIMFAYYFNWLSAIISLGTILFYSLFYTLWLKPHTPQNIVIGGSAGAMAPVGVWAAVTGSVGIEAVLLFAIIFFWTPPHFWALAIYCKEDYDEAGYPMMPNVKGDKYTSKHILIYTIITVITTLILAFVYSAPIYTVTATIMGGIFIKKTWRMYRQSTYQDSRGIFAFSIMYLFVLFGALVIDSIIINNNIITLVF